VKAISQHLSSAQVADLLDERLDPGDRDLVVTHLSTCAECRREVAELHGALPLAGRRRPRSRWIAGVAVAAAAVIAFVAIPQLTKRPPIVRDSIGETRTVATSPIETTSRVRIVEPADSGRVAPASVFRWRSAGADASYVLTIQDAAGGPVWTTTVSDTSAPLPPTVKLAPGARYFWSVDASLADGSSSSSGPHSFTAR
jgi:hypothetical protein